MINVVFFPRDPNPYQNHLQQALADEDIHATYLPWPTRSHSINLLLLPLQLIRARLKNTRILHLHWIYPFTIPGIPARISRPLAGAWFTLLLGTCRLIGVRIVWTAHNVLPHQQVFTDDLRRRRQLVRAAEAVIVHSRPALAALQHAGIHPHQVVVAPHGPYQQCRQHLITRGEARARLDLDPNAPTVLFFGRITTYKGVTDLLRVWPHVRSVVPGATLVIAGACDDRALRDDIEQLSRAIGTGVVLRLGHVPDELIPVLFSAAELSCLPFRQITTSGSAILAAGLGKLLIPDLDTLHDVHGDHVMRYPRTEGGLQQGLTDALRGTPPTSNSVSQQPAAWTTAAAAHAALFRQLHGQCLKQQQAKDETRVPAT